MEGHSEYFSSQVGEGGQNSMENSSLTPPNPLKHAREHIVVSDADVTPESGASPPTKRFFAHLEPPMDVDVEKCAENGGVPPPPYQEFEPPQDPAGGGGGPRCAFGIVF